MKHQHKCLINLTIVNAYQTKVGQVYPARTYCPMNDSFPSRRRAFIMINYVIYFMFLGKY